jgi:hypothetical protein
MIGHIVRILVSAAILGVSLYVLSTSNPTGRPVDVALAALAVAAILMIWANGAELIRHSSISGGPEDG